MAITSAPALRLDQPFPHQAFVVARAPAWLRRASSEQRSRLRQLALAADAARHRFKHAAAALPMAKTFGLEQLRPALTLWLGREVDPARAVLRWVDPDGHKPTLQRTLLEAALLNFHHSETQASAFGQGSGLFTDVGPDGTPDLAHPLALRPEAFARRCRALDIGGQFQQALSDQVPAQLPGAGSPVTGLPSLAWKAFDAQRKAFAAEACSARLAGRVGADSEALLANWRWASPGVAPNAAQAQRLGLLGFPLSQVVVFTPRHPGDGARSVVAYLPGDPAGAVRQYADARTFATALGARLQDPTFLAFFSEFVPISRRPAFIAQVKAANTTTGWLPAHLTWTAVPLSGDPFVEMYRIWAQQTLAQAASLAVPTALVDHHDSFERYAHWVALGEQLGLTFVLMVGSTIPGVNLIADAIVLGQGVYSLYEGAQALRQGDSQAALEYLFGAVENAGFLGLGKRPEPTPATVAFSSRLVPVTSSDGQVRLWLPELEDFAARDLPAPTVQPDAAGRYRQGARVWIKIEGQFYEVAPGASATIARLLHPERGGFAPQVQGDGAGSWRAAHESPTAWDGLQLIRRYGHAFEALPDDTLLDAQRLAGISDAQLREAHLSGSGMPALLKHMLARRLAEQQLDQVLLALRGTRRLNSPAAPLVDALRRIPGWPEHLALVYDNGHAKVVFGPDGSPNQVRLSHAELEEGTWPARLMSQVDARTLDALLGKDTSWVPADLAHQILAQGWGRALEAQRESLIQRMAEPVTDAGAAQATLRRQFPGLPSECIEALTLDITRSQRQALETGRMPPVIAEQAAEALRQQRVMLARDALRRGVAGTDRERLVFGLLPRLGAWARGVRIELRSNDIDGLLLQASGQAAGGRWVIVRNGRRYQAFDDHGLEISALTSLEGAIFAALPDSARALAAPGILSAEGLRAGLYEQALDQQALVRSLLGLVPDNRRFFRAPSHGANGAAGYALSGRGRLPAGPPVAFTPYLRQAMRALFPDVSEAELEELGALTAQDDHEITVLERLNRELARLRLDLNAWVERAAQHPDPHAHPNEFEHRAAISREIVRVWQRREGTQVYGATGYALTLRGLPVSELPVLTARFDHVRQVALRDMGLTRVGDGFLARFPNTRWLDLSLNNLSELPGLNLMPALERLSLDYTGRREMAEVAQAALPVAATLNHLDLAGGQLALTQADFQLLHQFPALNALDLQDNLIALDAQTAGAFNALPQLESLCLNGNPLGHAPVVGHLHNLVLLELRGAEINQFPPGLRDLMDRDPLRLREINLSDNDISTLPELGNTRFVTLARQERDNVNAEHYQMTLNLNGNSLSVDDVDMLEQAGIAYFSDPEPSSGSDIEQGAEEHWLLDCPDALATLIRAEQENPEAAEFYQLLSRVVQTADYRSAPVQTRQRTWRLVETWLQPGDQALPGLTELRQRLFALAQDTMGTCGDGVALTLDDMEFEAEGWRIVARSQAPGGGPLRELLDFQRRLWRRALVDDIARRIVRARVARQRALAQGDGGQAPALDPLDDIADARLDEGIDEVEVRFYLFQQLERPLDLPPARGMRYNTEVSERTIQQVGVEVMAADTPDAAARWAAQRPGFRIYLEHGHAQAFGQVRERWQEAADYLYTVGAGGNEPAGPIPEALEGLRLTLPEINWQPEGEGNPQLNEQQLRLAYDWVSQQQQRELDALALQLTRQLLGLEAIP